FLSRGGGLSVTSRRHFLRTLANPRAYGITKQYRLIPAPKDDNHVRSRLADTLLCADFAGLDAWRLRASDWQGKPWPPAKVPQPFRGGDAGGLVLSCYVRRHGVLR